MFMRSAALLLWSGYSVLSAANFFLLQNGNSWTYRVAGGAQQFTIRVGAPVEAGGKTWYPVTGYAQERVLVRYQDDQLLALDETSQNSMVLTSFLPGDSWPAPLRQCNQAGEAQGDRVKHENLGGSVENALEIRYAVRDCADAGVLSELYAENIGMVQRAVQSFAGPRVYELVSVRLVSGAARPAGRFSVSVEQAGAMLDVTLRVGAADGPITLPFTSGQEYDAILRDASGRELYRWSADRLFIQAQHTVTVDREWSAVLSIQRPNPGSYTVHAWLTTSTDAPLYAATAPVTVR